METRLDTFNGWKMTAAVETRPVSGGRSRFYIVPPLTCREFSRDEPLNPEKPRLFCGSFDSADEAFDTAFGVCRRAIANRINARNAPFPI